VESPIRVTELHPASLLIEPVAEKRPPPLAAKRQNNLDCSFQK